MQQSPPNREGTAPRDISPLSDSQRTPERKSEFAISFEKIVIESVAEEWVAIEELRGEIDAKRELMAVKQRQARDLLDESARIGFDVQALEAKVSEQMAVMVAKRQRSEENLRELVLTWERDKVNDVASRETTLRRAKDTETSHLSKEINELRRQLSEREAQLSEERLALTKHRQMLDSAHSERQLLKGQLDEVRRIEAQRSTATGASGAATPLNVSGIASPQADPQAAGSVREAELSAKVASLSAQLKMKDTEVETLRHHVGTSATHGIGSHGHSPSHHFRGAGTAGSVSASSSRSPSAGQQQPIPGAKDTTVYRSTSQGSTGAAPEPMPLPSSSNDRSVLLGLELSSRRQQEGFQGVYVVDVLPGGPAASSGMAAGDVILSWGDQPVYAMADINTLSARLPPEAFLGVDIATPSRSDPAVLTNARKVHIFVDGGRVDSHVQRRERYTMNSSANVSTTEQVTTATSTTTTTDRRARMERALAN